MSLNINDLSNLFLDDIMMGKVCSVYDACLAYTKKNSILSRYTRIMTDNRVIVFKLVPALCVLEPGKVLDNYVYAIYVHLYVNT